MKEAPKQTHFIRLKVQWRSGKITRDDALRALLVALAKRDPDGCEITIEDMKPPKPIKGPLDGTPHESLTANLGLMNYPMNVPIKDIMKQIKAKERRAKEAP